MASTTVRISKETQQALKELAKQEGKPMQEVLAQAIEAYRRQYILERTNAAYARLQSDPAAWQDEQDERQRWDVTLADGLDE